VRWSVASSLFCVELAPKGIRFTSIHPGFVAIDRVDADGLPTSSGTSSLLLG